jgi:hypothetical protein
MEAALQPDGRPTRRPNEDCTPTSDPASSHTTSTDMQLGTILGLLAQQNEGALDLMQSYAVQEGWVIGTPVGHVEDLAYVEVKPTERSLLTGAVQHLGGQGAEPWLITPILYSAPTSDSDLHLMLLSLYGELLLEGGKPGLVDAAWAAQMAAEHPSDALAQAVAGRLDQATDLILDQSWSPPSYVRGGTTAATQAYTLAHKLLILHILGGG